MENDLTNNATECKLGAATQESAEFFVLGNMLFGSFSNQEMWLGSLAGKCLRKIWSVSFRFVFA